MDKNSFYIELTYRSHQEESEKALHFIDIFQLKLSCLYKLGTLPEITRSIYVLFLHSGTIFSTSQTKALLWNLKQQAILVSFYRKL